MQDPNGTGPGAQRSGRDGAIYLQTIKINTMQIQQILSSLIYITKQVKERTTSTCNKNNAASIRYWLYMQYNFRFNDPTEQYGIAKKTRGTEASSSGTQEYDVTSKERQD